MYVLVVVLEAGIYISHLCWRIRYRTLLKEAKDSGRSIDELLSLRNSTQGTGDIEKGIIAASTTASPSGQPMSSLIQSRCVERQELK